MKKGIVICTGGDRSEFFENLMASLDGFDKYPIFVVINNSKFEFQDLIDRHKNVSSIHWTPNQTFEAGAIKLTLEKTDWDEFYFLQDSCEIKDTQLFVEAFHKMYEGYSMPFVAYYSMYLGKYRRKILEQIYFPLVQTKRMSVSWNIDFANEYFYLEKDLIQWPNEFPMISQTFEEKFGRTNMILENKYLKKYIGTWQTEMIKD